MKTSSIFIFLAILFSFTAYSQTGYCEGWENGYKEGYCYGIIGCVSPVAPVCPVPNIGENSYKDGYNRGLLKGKSDNQSSNTPNSGGAYSQLKPLKNTNIGKIVQESIRHKNSYKDKNRSSEVKIKNPIKYSNKTTVFPEMIFDQFITLKGLNTDDALEYLINNYWMFKSVDLESRITTYTNLENDLNTRYLKLFYDEKKM